MHQIHQFKFTIHLGKVQFGVLAIFTSIYFQSLTKNNQNENRFRFQGNDGARYVKLLKKNFEIIWKKITSEIPENKIFFHRKKKQFSKKIKIKQKIFQF